MFPLFKKKQDEHPQPVPPDLSQEIVSHLKHIDQRQFDFKSKESLIDLVLYLLPEWFTKDIDHNKLRNIIELHAKLFIETKALYQQPEPVKKGKEKCITSS